MNIVQMVQLEYMQDVYSHSSLIDLEIKCMKYKSEYFGSILEFEQMSEY